MCGRYKLEPLQDGWEALAMLLSPQDLAALRNVEPQLDIRPTTQIPVIRWAKDESSPRLVKMRWGLIPPRWKNERPPAFSINARCEEATAKPMWRDAVRYQRCLIPATGWHEWTPLVDESTGEILTRGDGRTPIKERATLSDPDSPALCLAGLWARARFRGEEIESCAIVTRAAVPPLIAIHDRMPIIVGPEYYRDWLDPTVTDTGIFREVTEADPPARIIVIERVRGTG